jgi:CRISPR-associated protein Cmr5
MDQGIAQQVIPAQRSLDQERASHAWKRIEHRSSHGETSEKYYQIARGMAADILANGLGQTLAFYQARAVKEEHYKWLLADTSGWVKQQLNQWLNPGIGEGELIIWLVNTANMEQYRLAKEELVAYLMWLKRFAEAKQRE